MRRNPSSSGQESEDSTMRTSTPGSAARMLEARYMRPMGGTCISYGMFVPTHLFMLLHSTSNTREGFILLLVSMAWIAPESLVFGRDFGFDYGSQSSDALPGALVELAIDKLDSKAPLNFQNEPELTKQLNEILYQV